MDTVKSRGGVSVGDSESFTEAVTSESRDEAGGRS